MTKFNGDFIQNLSRKITLLFVLSLGFVLLMENLSINVWSINYVKGNFNDQKLDSPKFPSNHLHARIWLAESYIKNRDYSKAVNILDSSIIAPSDLSNYFLGIAWASKNNYKKASNYWKQMHDVNILWKFAAKTDTENNVNSAYLLYKAAQEIDPENNTLPFVNFMLQRGYELSEVEATLEKSISTYSNSPLLLKWQLKLANVLIKDKKLEQAKAILSLLLENKVTNLDAMIGLGWVAYEEGNVNLAHQRFEDAVNLYPQVGDGYYALGLLLMKQNRSDLAVDWLKKAVTKSPNNEWWFIDLANEAIKTNNFGLAETTLLDCIQSFPKFSQAFYELAGLYERTGKIDLAKSNIKKALDYMKPENTDFLIRAGEIYELDGDYRNALSIYERVLAIDKYNSDALNEIKRLSNHRNMK